MSDESEAERSARLVQEAQPPWTKDGHGIKGPNPSVVSLRQQQNADPGPASVIRREPKQPAFPADESTSGGGISGDVVDVYGAVDGEPFLFHLFQDSPPTAVEPEP